MSRWSLATSDFARLSEQWSDGGWGAEDAWRHLETALTSPLPITLRSRDRNALAFLLTHRAETAQSGAATVDKLSERVAELETAARAVVSMWLLYGSAPARLSEAIDALEDVLIDKTATPNQGGSAEPKGSGR